VRTWLGEIDTVSAALATVSARAGGAEDSFVVRVTLVSGAHGVLQQTAASWTPEVAGVAIVAGSAGTIEVTGTTVWLSDRHGRRALDAPSDLALPSPPAAVEDARERFTHLELGPYTRLCEALRSGIDGAIGAAAVPVPTFADGLAEMCVLDAIRASHAAGGALTAVAR
jgi:hypothetical protein